MSEIILSSLFLLPPFLNFKYQNSSKSKKIKSISLSWLFFWSYFVLLSVLFLVLNLESIKFNPLFIFVLTTLIYGITNKPKNKIQLHNIFIRLMLFFIFLIISVSIERINIGGDAIWSTVLSIDLLSLENNGIKLTMLGHRPIALPLISSLTIMTFNQIFFAFSIFTSLIFIVRFFSVIYPMLNKKFNNHLISVLAMGLVISSPTILELSFYWGNHIFLALGFLELFLYFNNKTHDANEVDIYLLMSCLIFFRREAFIFIVLLFVFYSHLINKKLSPITFILPSVWFIHLYLVDIPLQKSTSDQFLLIGVSISLFMVFFYFNKINFFYNKRYIFVLLIFVHILLIFQYSGIFWSVFLNNFLGLGGWGMIGSILLFAICFLTIKNLSSINFTSILILLFMILPYVNAQSGDGWRYGFTSSFNRIIFYLFFIIIYEFLMETTSEV